MWRARNRRYACRFTFCNHMHNTRFAQSLRDRCEPPCSGTLTKTFQRIVIEELNAHRRTSDTELLVLFHVTTQLQRISQTTAHILFIEYTMRTQQFKQTRDSTTNSNHITLVEVVRGKAIATYSIAVAIPWL